MATNAVIVVKDQVNARYVLRRVPFDGYPQALGEVLRRKIKTVEQALNLESALPKSFSLNPRPQYLSDPLNEDLEDFNEIISDANYAYRFNLRNQQWYLWVEYFGWVPLSWHDDPDPFESE